MLGNGRAESSLTWQDDTVRENVVLQTAVAIPVYFKQKEKKRKRGLSKGVPGGEAASGLSVEIRAARCYRRRPCSPVIPLALSRPLSPTLLILPLVCDLTPSFPFILLILFSRWPQP